MPKVRCCAVSILVFTGAIRSGHSGGPILDAKGLVVGVAKGVLSDPARIERIFGTRFERMLVSPAPAVIAAFLDLVDFHPGEATTGQSERTVRPAVVRTVCRR